MDLRNVVAGLGLLIALPLETRADIVTNSLRRYGLGDVTAITVSSDGRHMASAGHSGAFIWDITPSPSPTSGSTAGQNGIFGSSAQSRLRHRLLAHGTRVHSIAFSPNGRVLLTGGSDRLIRAWDVESGSHLHTYTGHEGPITKLAFSPDGERFVSAADNSARVWSLATGEVLSQVVVPASIMTEAIFTPDGAGLVTADLYEESGIRLWDLSSEKEIRTLGADHRLIGGLAFTQRGHLVTLADDLTIRMWNITTGDLLQTLTGGTLSITDVFASPESSLATAACQDGRVIVWNADTGAVVHETPGDWLLKMTVVHGTSEVITANADYRLRRRDVVSGQVLEVYEGHTTSTTLSVDFSPDGRYVLSGGVETSIRLWDRKTGELVRTFEGHGAGTSIAKFSADGSRIVTTRGQPQPAVQMWDTESGQSVREFTWQNGWPSSAALARDVSLVAAGAQDGKIRVWDTTGGSLVRTFTSSAQWVAKVAISPDGKLLAAGGSAIRPIAEVWDIATGQNRGQFELEAGSVVALQFSNSGHELLVGWEDGYVRVFDLATGELIREVLIPAAFLCDAVFSPDNRFILTGEGWPFHTARLWETRSGKMLRVFGLHTAEVKGVAFNRQGTEILTGSDTVQLWAIGDIAGQLWTRRVSNGLELSWSLGSLQTSTDITGPWIDVPNAASPHLVPMEAPHAYYRVSIPAE